MAEEGKDGRFIERHPILDPVTEGRREQRGVIGEPADDLRVGEAAAVLQRLRQVPMEQVDQWLDARRQQGVNEALVEVEARLVDRAGPRGQHARPADAEAIGARPQIGHQPDVFRVAVVVITRDIAGAAIRDRAGSAGEGVPDRRPATVLGRCSLDLVRGGGEAPGEVSRKGLGEPGRVGVERGRWTHRRIVPATSAARSTRSSPPEAAVRCADSAAGGGACTLAGHGARVLAPAADEGTVRVMPKAPSRATKPAASPEPGPEASVVPKAPRAPRRTSKPAVPKAKRAPAVTGAAFGDDWWKRGVVYQVYPRSFADANDDGVRRPARPDREARLSQRRDGEVARHRCDLALADPPVARASTSATTSPTTTRSTRSSGPSTTSIASSPRPIAGASGSCSTW